MTEFFRQCPSCRRRFHIRLEEKKLTALTRKTLPGDQPHRTVAQYRGSPVVLVQGENRPIMIDVETFQYTYKCAHCGHEWSEKHVHEKREN